MIYVIISVCIIFFIFLIGLMYYNQANNIDNIKIKLEEVKKNIKIAQEEEIEILTKISKDFYKLYNKKPLSNLSKIKNKALDIFELENELDSLNKTLNEFIEDNSIDNYESKNELHSILIELKSLKQFYNKYTKKYNDSIGSFKYVLLRLIQKYKKFPMFTIKKEVEFEILKK